MKIVWVVTEMDGKLVKVCANKETAIYYAGGIGNIRGNYRVHKETVRDQTAWINNSDRLIVEEAKKSRDN